MWDATVQGLQLTLHSPLMPSLDWQSLTQASLQSLHVSIGLACISRLTIKLGSGMVECLMQNWPIRLPPGRQEPFYIYQPQPQSDDSGRQSGTTPVCSAKERRGIVNVRKGEWSNLNSYYHLSFNYKPSIIFYSILLMLYSASTEGLQQHVLQP